MSHPPLEIRPTRYDDPAAVELTAQVQAWYREIYGGTDDNPIAADEFTPPGGEFLVGFVPAAPSDAVPAAPSDAVPAAPSDAVPAGPESGTAVAMAGWRRWDGPPPLPGTRPAELRRMFVREGHRGRGYARRLLADLERRAVAGGCDLMILEAGERQTEALSLYASCGYRLVPDFGFYAGWSGAVHLGKRLTTG